MSNFQERLNLAAERQDQRDDAAILAEQKAKIPVVVNPRALAAQAGIAKIMRTQAAQTAEALISNGYKPSILVEPKRANPGPQPKRQGSFPLRESKKDFQAREEAYEARIHAPLPTLPDQGFWHIRTNQKADPLVKPAYGTPKHRQHGALLLGLDGEVNRIGIDTSQHLIVPKVLTLGNWAIADDAELAPVPEIERLVLGTTGKTLEDNGLMTQWEAQLMAIFNNISRDGSANVDTRRMPLRAIT
jgi:hypothetical protein